LKALSEEIDGKVSAALSLVCTEETVKTVKAVRAELTKDFGSLEEQRKSVKTAIMNPYDQFEGKYKEYVSDKFRQADNILKSRIDEVENELKDQKRKEVKEYFDEYRLSRGVDFVNMETWRPNITLSVSMKALKTEAKAFIDRICDDLTLIDTQEYKAEIMVEYRRSLNCSQAITAVKTRYEAIEREKQRQAELEERRKADAEAAARVQQAIQVQQPLEPPKVAEPPKQEDDPIKTLGFTVTAPLSKLRVLKQFLMDGGYQFE